MADVRTQAVKRRLKRIVRGLAGVSTLRFGVIFVVMAVILSVLFVLAIDFLWDGRFNPELELAGILVPILDGCLLVVIFTTVFDELREESEQRRTTEQNLREAQRIAKTGNWTYEPATDTLTWSEEIFRIFEVSPRDFGATYEAFLDFIHPDDRARVNRAYQDSLKNALPYQIPHRLLLKNGRIKYVLECGETTYDRAGTPLRTIGTVQDITESTLAHEELREKEEKLRTITQTAQDAIVMIDDTGSISFWNPAAEQIFGYSGREALGRDMHSLLSPPKYAGAFQKGLARFRETGEGPAIGKTLELEAVRKGGAEFKIELSLSSIKTRDGWHAVGIIRDITQRKQAEEEIRRLNEDLERKVEKRTKQLLDAQEELVSNEKLSVLGQLSGRVGHELRNPLGIISNAVYFLKTVQPDADAIVGEYLGIIKNEVENAERIISDLLDFARTKTSQAIPCRARELVEQGLRKCGIPGTVLLSIEVPETLPLVRVDPLQMGQVFQNLIMNAVQAMPEGGALRIAARRAPRAEDNVQRLKNSGSEPRTTRLGSSKSLNAGHDSDLIEISVADTGAGISAENMKKLFQPLFTTKAKGIGLGLVVSRKLVELNGGKIDVKSVPDRGATFSVLLPVEKGGEPS